MLKKILKTVIYTAGLIFFLFAGLVVFLAFFGSDDGENDITIENTNAETAAESVSDRNYYHPLSGWRFEIPAGWRLQESDVAKKLYQESKDAIEAATGETITRSPSPSGELALIHSPGNTMNFKYQEYDTERFQEFEQLTHFFYQTVLTSYQQTAAQEGLEAWGKRTETAIGPITFEKLVITMQNPKTGMVEMTNLTYLSRIQGKLALITFSCMHENLCREMETAVNSSVFESVMESETLESETLYSKAVEMLNKQKMQEAYDLVSKAIEMDQSNPWYYILRSDVSSRMGADIEQRLADMDAAEQLAPQLPGIYFERQKIAQTLEDPQTYHLNSHKVSLFDYLLKNKTPFPPVVYGMSEREFRSITGEFGYVHAILSPDFQEIVPIPEVNEAVDVIFQEIEVFGEHGAVQCFNRLSPSKGVYLITAYNLLTAFVDGSGKYFHLYYQVKYTSKQS